MTEFVTVCRVEDVPEGEGRTVEAGGEVVAVFREGGQYFAIDDVCPHMGASLGEGQLAGGIVTCPWHAWRFRLADGAWADYPRLKVGCYPVRVVDGAVQVEISAGVPAARK